MIIACEKGEVISVTSANFGRLDTSTCPHSSLDTTTCWSPTSWSRWSRAVVQGKCQGENSCLVPATVTTFGGDPCSGTHKYLTVSYTCSGGCSSNLSTRPPVSSSSYSYLEFKVHLKKEVNWQQIQRRQIC